MSTPAMVDPADHAEDALDRARLHGVVPDIHIEDFIFQFLITHHAFASKKDALHHYFSDGQKSCAKIMELISTFLEPAPVGRNISMLEFASGYGCVTRHLAKQHGYDVTSCDIHPAAIAFITEKIGLDAQLSTHRPADFAVDEAYDVTFALSFFSHMPDATWGDWLAALLRAVRPGGLLVFTTHGRTSRQHFGDPALDERGYWFRPDSEQKDLDGSEYGQTIVTPAYVFRQLDPLSDAWPCFFQQAYWWEHQDVYVVRRASA